MENEYRRLLDLSAVLPDLGVGLVELNGADALEWLQGQATNDLRHVAGDAPTSFCLCEPTGQMLAVCDIWKDDNRLLVSTDNVAALMNRVETMVILEDVQARDLSADYTLASIQGPKAPVESVSQDQAIVLRNPRLNSGGWDVWVTGDVGQRVRIGTDAYEVARIEAGIPKRNGDYTSKTLPPELGPAFEEKHVSYNKGCYTGQEVLMRIHSRGHTNKTWVGLLLESPVFGGAKVTHESREDAGVTTSAAISPEFGPIAAAMLRNEAAQEGQIVTVGGVRGTVTQMPIRKS